MVFTSVFQSPNGFLRESNPGNRRRLVSVLVNCSVFAGCPGGGCVDRSVVLENGVSDES